MADYVFRDEHSHTAVENRQCLLSWFENATLRGGAWNFLTLAAYLSYSPLSSKELSGIKIFYENYEPNYLVILNSYLMKIAMWEQPAVKAFEDEEQDLGPSQRHTPETPSTESPFSFEFEEKADVTNSTGSTSVTTCFPTTNTMTAPNAHSQAKLYCSKHNRVSSNKPNYNRHLQESRGQGRSFKCQKCSQSYTRKDYLIAHGARIKHHFYYHKRDGDLP